MTDPIELTRNTYECPKGHPVEVVTNDVGVPFVSPPNGPPMSVTTKDGKDGDQVPALHGFGYVCRECRTVYWFGYASINPVRATPIQLIGFILAYKASMDVMTGAQIKLAEVSIMSTCDQILGEVTKRGLLDRRLSKGASDDDAGTDPDRGEFRDPYSSGF